MTTSTQRDGGGVGGGRGGRPHRAPPGDEGLGLPAPSADDHPGMPPSPARSLYEPESPADSAGDMELEDHLDEASGEEGCSSDRSLEDLGPMSDGENLEATILGNKFVHHYKNDYLF
jgi:hypothetical protein